MTGKSPRLRVERQELRVGLLVVLNEQQALVAHQGRRMAPAEARDTVHVGAGQEEALSSLENPNGLLNEAHECSARAGEPAAVQRM